MFYTESKIEILNLAFVLDQSCGP